MASSFGGPAWSLDEATRQYYLHSFLPEQPDLNWRNPQVQAAMFEVARFWLDRGIDGFRADVVHNIGKSEALADHPEQIDDLVAFMEALTSYELQEEKP